MFSLTMLLAAVASREGTPRQEVRAMLGVVVIDVVFVVGVCWSVFGGR